MPGAVYSPLIYKTDALNVVFHKVCTFLHLKCKSKVSLKLKRASHNSHLRRQMLLY
jgi:hypothetical protein